MKFNKELDENAVPEWKEKYLDYKQAKKKLKAVARALVKADRSPPKPNQGPSPFGDSSRDAPVHSYLRGRGRVAHDEQIQGNIRAGRSQSQVASSLWQRQNDLERATGASPASRQVDELSPLRQRRSEDEGARPHKLARYGSIIGSPPGSNSPSPDRLSRQRTQASLLELPHPALDPAQSKDTQDRDFGDPEVSSGSSGGAHEEQDPSRLLPAELTHAQHAHEPSNDMRKPALRSIFKPHRQHSLPQDTRRPAMLQRFLSVTAGVPTPTRPGNDPDIALEAYRELDFRRAEFFHFLDKQLAKIDDFYNGKEEEAKERLTLLREQLHILRSQRLEEVEAAERRKRKDLSNGVPAPEAGGGTDHEGYRSKSLLPRGHDLRKSVVSQMDSALNRFDKVRSGQVGKTSKAMRDLGTPRLSYRPNEDDRDYTRKPQPSVTYRVAKRKLKSAFVEYYRALELLKSYGLLNQTAFRKITKKCDKTVADMPGKEYMHEKVDRAQFVTSQVLDGLMNAAEDLYSRYFERGNRKIAISKLRGTGYKSSDYTGSTLRTGLLAGAGLALAIDGLVHGINHRTSPNNKIRTLADFLLQIYAGYFFFLLLMFLFCSACREFKRHKVNYVFIFEFNGRHNLDWRQLMEMPALFFFLLGLAMELNFNFVGAHAFSVYTYWPVVLIGATVLVMITPVPLYYHRSRLWFLESVWRLWFSGLYPVEFRDLFFGDIFCSSTYTFGNIEMFFCLYDRGWDNPKQCGSSASMLFGFFTTLPGIMRALQCIRRFIDTRKAFPHLANCGKYSCTILSYMALSLYRIYRTKQLLILFAFFSTINSCYCIVWDLVMDFSFGDFSAKWPLLRKQLLFGHVWWYYTALLLDPILRFNWIFYVIFANYTEHSTIVSFSIALSEVLRRGMWALFRVENEQCANNRNLLAARVPPLPFSPRHAPLPPTEEVTEESPMMQTLRRVGSTMANAHSEDYVRRKPRKVSTSVEIPESDDEDE